MKHATKHRTVFHPLHFRRAFLILHAQFVCGPYLKWYFLFPFLFEDRQSEWIQHTPVLPSSVAHSWLLNARNGTTRCPWRNEHTATLSGESAAVRTWPRYCDWWRKRSNLYAPCRLSDLRIVLTATQRNPLKEFLFMIKQISNNSSESTPSFVLEQHGSDKIQAILMKRWLRLVILAMISRSVHHLRITVVQINKKLPWQA